MTAQQVAKRLRAAGLPVLRVAEADDSVDGEVTITDLVSVQVGDTGYLGVYKRLNEDEFYFYRETMRIDQIIADVRNACGMEHAE